MHTVKDFLWITAGTIIVGTSVFLFLIPSQVAVASVSGLAIVLSQLLPISVSLITLLLNVLCLVLGFLLVGREFSGKTIYTSLLLPVILGIYERLLPNFQSMTGDAFIDMLCHIFLVSMGLALLFSRNASSGGLDIIAKILNKYFHIEIGSAMSLVGILVCLSSAFVYDCRIVVLSFLGTYLQGQAVDHFIFGIGAKSKVSIVSEKSEEIIDYILHQLDSGATLYQAKGAYTGNQQLEVVTIVDKQKYAQLLQYLEKRDPEAYITVYTVKETREKPRSRHL